MPHLDAYVRAAATLPAMPEVAQKLIRSFDRDDLSLGELADLVSRDNSLAVKVLRTANSARFSPSHQISSLRDAAATLGMTTLRDLTLASCLAGSLPAVKGFDRLQFWRGTMAVATYSTTLAKTLGVDEETAYVAGLMLRTGQILMAMVDADAFQQVQANSQRVDVRFDVEQGVFGLMHSTVTAELAQRWHFPEPMIAAFRAAGDPLAAHPFDRGGATLRLASAVADCREFGVPLHEGLDDAQHALIAHVQLDLGWLQAHLPDHSLATAGVDSLLH
jgi:HD-like signal output (HDOD) protein